MDNQQPRPFEERLAIIARNAKFGDGYYWKHPECKNYKVIFTSTCKDLLEVKRAYLPELFTSGVKEIPLSNAAGRFANAKPLFRIASRTSEVFSRYKMISHMDLLSELGIEDLGLWYLDDGCTIARRDSEYGYTRTSLCIGSICQSDSDRNKFLTEMRRIFNCSTIGNVGYNTPDRSTNNMRWNIPTKVSEKILEEGAKHCVLKHKFPSWVRFRDHSVGEVVSKGKSTRSTEAIKA